MKRKTGIFSLVVMLLLVLGLVPAVPVAAATTVTLVYYSAAGSNIQVAVSADGTDYGSEADAVAAWVHGSWPSISGATWISSAFNTEDPVNDSWRKFTTSFDVPAGAGNIAGSIEITADNAEEVKLNDTVVGSDGEVYGPFVDNQEWNTILTYPLTPTLGTNDLEIVVRNYAMAGGTATSNPTGLIYKLTVQYTLVKLGGWDTALEAYNLVGTDHTVTAFIDTDVAGVKVWFDVQGANPTNGDSLTNASGRASFTYTGNNPGMDTIIAYFDEDFDGGYEAGEPTIMEDFEVVPSIKYWFQDNFLTGGGTIKTGKTPTWNIAGNIGFLPDGRLVGSFNIVKHSDPTNHYKAKTPDFTSLVFDGSSTSSPPTEEYNRATFTGTFTDKDGAPVVLTLVITDNGEGKSGTDTVQVSALGIGQTAISGGNYQVHDGFK